MRNLKSAGRTPPYSPRPHFATSCSDPEARTGGSSAAVSPADAAVKRLDGGGM